MTRTEIDARMEAYDEAIEHIDLMDWTNDKEERRQSKKLAAILRRHRDRWYSQRMQFSQSESARKTRK